MKLDTSAAPEIAILSGELDAAAEAGAIPGAPTGPATIGYLAACLRLLVADPQSWWGLVRFDPQRPVRIPVAAPGPGCEAWLLVLPPGHQGDGRPDGPDWAVACLVAGAMAEHTGPGCRPLSHGRTMVRGGRRPAGMVNTGSGYAVSLHARSFPL
ncbi:MAG TPA: cysteine dioxygenase [Streptosporangiaceae bacterium]